MPTSVTYYRENACIQLYTYAIGQRLTFIYNMPVIQFYRDFDCTTPGHKDTINLKMCRVVGYPNYLKREQGNSYDYIYADDFDQTAPKPPFDPNFDDDWTPQWDDMAAMDDIPDPQEQFTKWTVTTLGQPTLLPTAVPSIQQGMLRCEIHPVEVVLLILHF